MFAKAVHAMPLIPSSFLGGFDENSFCTQSASFSFVLFSHLPGIRQPVLAGSLKQGRRSDSPLAKL
jgi:hypothetical protein